MRSLVDCSTCRTPLELPNAYSPAVRCAVCHAVTHVAASLPPPAFRPQWGPPAPPPAGVHGKRRAVICGVSYRGTNVELKGCVNDAKFMKFMLVNRFKFPESSVLMLTEDEIDPYRIPTNQNIRMALFWLMQGCRAGDSLVFHYSGHGSQQRDTDGDEVDGYDETICPLDFQTKGMILDDEINATIVRPLPYGAKLHAIIDACHSGTVLDLPFLCRMNRQGQHVWEDHRPPTGAWKGTSGGEAISFSGCDDDQIAADTSALSRITSTGAMTYAFVKSIEQGHGHTYGSLLNAMRDIIRNTNASIGRPMTSLLNMLAGVNLGGLRQEPQLTANEAFDIYRKPFSL